MAKTCKCEDCNYPVFGNSYCKFHQYLREDYKKPELKKTKIRSVSKKRSKQLKVYAKKRVEKANGEQPICYAYAIGHPVAGCQYFATDFNHAQGRENERLLDLEGGQFICRVCHNFYTTNSRLGIELGIFKSKHTNNDT